MFWFVSCSLIVDSEMRNRPIAQTPTCLNPVVHNRYSAAIQNNITTNHGDSQWYNVRNKIIELWTFHDIDYNHSLTLSDRLKICNFYTRQMKHDNFKYQIILNQRLVMISTVYLTLKEPSLALFVTAAATLTVSVGLDSCCWKFVFILSNYYPLLVLL